MPSKVQIIKEIRAAAEQDPGAKEGARLFDARSTAFQQVFVDRGPAPAIEADQTMAEYFANWWVGEEYRESGSKLRAALKAFRAADATRGELPATDGGVAVVSAATDEAVFVAEPESEVAGAETQSVLADQVESGEIEKAYQLAESAEIGDTIPPRKLSDEQVAAELAALKLFATASQERLPRRVARRMADLEKAAARRA